MATIRPLRQDDWPAVWNILHPVFRAGDTYSFAPSIDEEEAYRVWVAQPLATFVATNQDDRVLGTYYLKANQPGQGAHVCNCGYAVAQSARGVGVASAMCEHSQQEALRQGFRAMQYNLVVATNVGAIRLWKRHGFEIAGTLREAFLHPAKGYVDAYVMYKTL